MLILIDLLLSVGCKKSSGDDLAVYRCVHVTYLNPRMPTSNKSSLHARGDQSVIYFQDEYRAFLICTDLLTIMYNSSKNRSALIARDLCIWRLESLIFHYFRELVTFSCQLESSRPSIRGIGSSPELHVKLLQALCAMSTQMFSSAEARQELEAVWLWTDCASQVIHYVQHSMGPLLQRAFSQYLLRSIELSQDRPNFAETFSQSILPVVSLLTTDERAFKGLDQNLQVLLPTPLEFALANVGIDFIVGGLQAVEMQCCSRHLQPHRRCGDG